MAVTSQVGRNLVHKRRLRWFLQRAVQQAIQPPTALSRQSLTTADILARWDAEGMGDAWATRTDIGDSNAYARALRETAQRRERNG
jgi:hypothetical protein